MSVSLLEILHNIREQLAGHGLFGMRRLGMAFSINDRDRSGYFDFTEFESILGKAGIFIKRQSLTSLYRFFDRGSNERVYYPDFLRSLQGQLSQPALDLVNRAFDSLDRDGRGAVDINLIFDSFNPSTHPHVLSGQKTVALLKKEFQQAMEGAGANNNGLVIRDEFIDYFAAISASIQADYFPILIERGFNLSNNNSNESLPSPAVIEGLLSEIRGILREKVRQKTIATKSEQEQLRLAFKHYDLNNSGLLSYGSFLVALERYGIILNSTKSRQLFSAFSTNDGKSNSSNNLLNYAEFAAALYESYAKSTAYTKRQENEQKKNLLSATQKHNLGRNYFENNQILLSQPNKTTITNGIEQTKEEIIVPRVIFVLGGPFVGVNEVCQRMAKVHGYEHISISDENKNNSSVSVVDYLIEVIRKGVNKGTDNFVVSGFPSSLAWLNKWNEVSYGVHVPFCLFLDSPNDLLFERCKIALPQADNLTINKIISNFHDNELPVIDSFQTAGKLRIINAASSFEQTWKQVQIQLQQI